MHALNEIAKHWLLNLAVYYSIPLGLVLPSVREAALNVDSIPHFEPEDYARCLLDLFDSAMISMHSDDDELMAERTQIVRIIDQFLRLPRIQGNDRGPRIPRRASIPGVTINYALTALGGKAWEERALPDWHQMVEMSFGQTEGELLSANLDRLIAYLGWCSETDSCSIRRETIEIKALSDHNILYWKRLPVVYHSSFELHPHRESDYREVPGWLKAWKSSATSTWYKKPWELPGWPATDRIPGGED